MADTFKEDFKGEEDEIARRVFHALWKDDKWEAVRTTKAVALLFQHLSKRGILDENALDKMLEQIVA